MSCTKPDTSTTVFQKSKLALSQFLFLISNSFLSTLFLNPTTCYLPSFIIPLARPSTSSSTSRIPPALNIHIHSFPNFIFQSLRSCTQRSSFLPIQDLWFSTNSKRRLAPTFPLLLFNNHSCTCSSPTSLVRPFSLQPPQLASQHRRQ